MSLYKIIVEEITPDVIDKKEYNYKSKKYALNDYLKTLIDINTNNFECDRKIVALYYKNDILHKNVYEHGNGYSIKLVDAYYNSKLWKELDNESE